jgi:hypothetical protein
VNNEYTDEELVENPPEQVQCDAAARPLWPERSGRNPPQFEHDEQTVPIRWLWRGWHSHAATVR